MTRDYFTLSQTIKKVFFLSLFLFEGPSRTEKALSSKFSVTSCLNIKGLKFPSVTVIEPGFACAV
jgi:hypothetical protein